MTQYAKAIVAVLLAGLTTLQTALTGDGISDAEWMTVAIAVVTAVGVYLVPNARPADTAQDPPRVDGVL